ncbi:hypothetical protein ACFE04_016322 [Oxalis oulophora]
MKNQIRDLICATLVLSIVCGSAVTTDYCSRVEKYFFPCMVYVGGISGDLTGKCCRGIEKLNKRTKQTENGSSMTCQCIENMAYVMNIPFDGSRIGDMSAKCNLHFSFPISVRMDCSRV